MRIAVRIDSAGVALRFVTAALLVVASEPALASADLVTLLNQRESEARRVLVGIALAPSVTGGIRELTPPSTSKLCSVKQLSTVEADIYLVDGIVMRVEDRRGRRVLGDMAAVRAFKATVETHAGKVDVRDDVRGGVRLDIRTGDVTAFFWIVQRGSAYELASEGAEVVGATAKCDERKAADGALARETKGRERLQKIEDVRTACLGGGDGAACAEGVKLAGFFNMQRRYEHAVAGCDLGDGELCSAAAETVFDGRFNKTPETCAAAFAAVAKACSSTPTQLCASARAQDCLGARPTAAQRREMEIGTCVFSGDTRAACSGRNAGSSMAIAAVPASGAYCRTPSPKVLRGKLAGFIGRPWREVEPLITKNPALQAGCGGDLLDDAHAIASCKIDGKLALLVTTPDGPPRAGGAAPLQRVADAMTWPTKGELIIGRCRVNKRSDPMVLGLVEEGDDDIPAAMRAWRVNPSTHCIEEMPGHGVDCERNP